MPKMIKKRAAQKTRQDENINETVTDIRQKLKERQRTLVYSLLAFGVLIVAAGFFFIYARTTESKARELQYEGIKLFNGSGQAQAVAPQERYRSALEKFKASYASKKSPVTLLYIANSYYELGNYDETLKTLKELTGRYSDPKITSLAHYKMAMAYIKKGDTAGALNAFNSITSAKDSPLQDMALLESGSLLESMGRKEEARAKYKELVTKFPSSPLASTAKARLGN